MIMHRRKLTLVLIALILFPLAIAGKPLPFSPLVRNWSTADLDAGRQNWDIAQDENGVIYLANHSCLLEFDGFTWKQIMLPGNANARSVSIDDSGRIYVGSYEEFGYFTKNATGMLEYHSVSSLCQPEMLSNCEVWNIVFLNGKVYFQSFARIFVYDGGAVSVIDDETINLFNINGNLYSQLMYKGVCRFHEDGQYEIVVSDFLNISAMLPFGNDKVLMISTNDGLFLYDPGTGAFERFKTEADYWFLGGDLNRGTLDNDGNIIIGSISKGIIAIDKDGRYLWHVDRESGLQNDTILGMLRDRDGNIWVALDDGISIILKNTSYSCYDAVNEAMGMVYDVAILNNKMYLATNKGLYILTEDGLVKDERVKGQTWYVKNIDNELFIGNNFATYCMSGDRLYTYFNDTGAIFMKEIYWSDNERHLIEGTYLGIRRYDMDPALRQWKGSDYFPETLLAKNIEIDATYHIWYEHLQKGIFRLTLSGDMKNLTEIKNFKELSGNTGRMSLFKINGRIAFTDWDSFFTYDDLTGEIIPFSTLNEVVGHVKGVHAVTRGNGNTYWLLGKKELVQLDCSDSQYRIIREIPLTLFGIVSEDRSNVVYDGNSGNIYLCLDNKVIRISESVENGKSATLSLLECVVSDGNGNDYVLSEPQKIRTRRGYNHLSFRLRYPEYQEYGTTIQYRIKGMSDNWETLPSSQMVLSFQRLKCRRYHFQARLVLSDNQEINSIDIPVSVLSKWYSSRLMTMIYVIIILALIFLFSQWDKKHTMEVLLLKDRVDEAKNAKDEVENLLKEKDEELASMVMSGAGNDSKRWTIIKANFERVEEHFFSTLLKEYPDLTSSDLKFCALLKMNMSTKEIADVLNLTTRGVESARYRLRKKFNLKQDESLTAFIHSIE